ncbi:MAG: PadR family transcriptional regulator [Candidatus Micrarchaeaceae archaeon]
MRGGYCKCGPFRVSIVPQGLLKPYILKLLSEKPMHGFELMEQIFERTNGMWQPGPAAIYPTLEWLERNGYIEAVEKKERPEKARKEYKITNEGILALSNYNSEAKQIAKKMEEFSDAYKRM